LGDVHYQPEPNSSIFSEIDLINDAPVYVRAFFHN